jgi:hypothetical protein
VVEPSEVPDVTWILITAPLMALGAAIAIVPLVVSITRGERRSQHSLAVDLARLGSDRGGKPACPVGTTNRRATS